MSFLPQHPQRLTQWLLIALTAGVWALLLESYLPWVSAKQTVAPSAATFATLSVQRINVVDPDGSIRLVIANSEHFPDAILRGKSYTRSIEDAVGLIFYNQDGNESGGLGLSRLADKNQSALIFDYTHQPTDGIGMYKRESEDGKQLQAGLFISDRRPFVAGELVSTQGVERISLSNQDQDASLIISDAQGQPRISIGVDKTGEPRIELMDAAGQVVYQAGQESAGE